MTTAAPARPRTLPCTADQVVRWAVGQVGTTEDPPNSNRQPYGAAYGTNGVAWCALFVWASFHAAHVDLRSVLGGGGLYSTQRMAQLAHAAGWRQVKPQEARAGDLVFFDFQGGGRAGIEHVGIVRAQGNPGELRTVEGNTSANGSQTNGGAVALKSRPYAHMVVLYRPPYAATTAGGQAQRYTLHRTLRLRRLVRMRGNDVRAAQKLVGAHIDGVYGPKTAAAVGAWQRRLHLTVDGEFGPQSARAAGWNYAG